MASQSEVRLKRWFLGVGGLVLAFCLFLMPSFAWASTTDATNDTTPIVVTGGTPTGGNPPWDVTIDTYTLYPEYMKAMVTAPTGATQVKAYLYHNDYQTSTNTPYDTFTYAVTGGVSSSVDVWNMQGGTPTYIKMTWLDANGVESAMPSYFMIVSQEQRVRIDNWGDLENWLSQFFTPSEDAKNNLQNAINGMEDQIGVTSVTSAGSSLQTGLAGITGFSTADAGDLAFTVPIVGTNKYGNPINVTLFSADELAKYPWLDTMRTGIEAMMWITFVVYLIVRFTPMFKV